MRKERVFSPNQCPNCLEGYFNPQGKCSYCGYPGHPGRCHLNLLACSVDGKVLPRVVTEGESEEVSSCEEVVGGLSLSNGLVIYHSFSSDKKK